MSWTEATSLAGAAQLCTEPYDPAGDREALAALAVSCERFSPLVGLDDSPAPESLLLDVGGVAPLFGGEAALAEAVVRDFRQRGLALRAAVADTVGAAWAVAHFGELGMGNFYSIPRGANLAALRPLPIEALRLPEDVVELLHSLGIYRIGQLEPLPRRDLTSRFGPQLLRRWDQATGRCEEPIGAAPSPPELRAEHALEHPTTRRRAIELVVERLIARVARLLVREGHGAVRLDCRLDCSAGESVDLSVGLFQPTASPRHLFELVEMRLERARLPGPVSAISVEAAATAPFERRQEDLFADGRSPKHRHQLAGLVDRLAGRLGRRSVLRAHLVRDAQPELAYRYDPLVQGSPSRRPPSGRSRVGQGGPNRAQRTRGTTGPGGPHRELPPRPLRLFPQPFRLTAVSLMPEGPPLEFQLEGRLYRIAHTWGPERIETGWWRGRPVRRDYYRVETTTGHRHWLFRDLGDGGWFLHGTFE